MYYEYIEQANMLTPTYVLNRIYYYIYIPSKRLKEVLLPDLRKPPTKTC